MKKLGLRAVAGGLAVLMAVAGFAPATASAADTLVTAAASKTLVITADMVDDDGEIVISGEKWDRIIVEKEAAAKDIYFDGVDVGELVVESGSKSNIQLWDVAAEALTVKEPELVELDMVEVRKLLSDKETRDQAMDLYMKVQAENKNAMNQAPSIVTMDEAVVGTVTASGSASLDFNKGEVKSFNLVASTKVGQVNVTLKGYDGEVTYKGGEKFNIVNFNAVDCALEKLTVDSSASNNYLNVKSKDSSVVNVEVAGNAAVSLNIPATKLEIAKNATAAQVGVLGEVAEMNIAADNATVNVGASAKVEAANVIGNKANIGGLGKVENVEITGTGAYVSTNGSKVKGENTYRPTVYVEPEKPKVVINNIDLEAGENVQVVKNEDGTAKVLYDGQYKKAFFNVPDSVDVNRVYSVVMNITANGGFGLKIHTDKGVDITNNSWFPSGNGTAADYTYQINPSKQKIAQLEFMSTGTGQSSLTVNSITFLLLEETPEEVPEEERPLVYENKVYTFKDLSYAWSNVTNYTVDANGALKITVNGNYKSIIYMLPDELNASDYPEVLVKFTSEDGLAGKIWKVGEDADNPLITEYGLVAAGGKMSLQAIDGENVNKIAFMSMGTGEYTATIESITFIGSGNVGKDTPGTGDGDQGEIEGGDQGGTEGGDQGGTEGGDQGGTEGGDQGGNENPTPDAGEDTDSMKGKIDFSTKVKFGGDEPTVSGSSLVFTANNNKCAFDLPNVVNSGETLEFTVDMDVTSLETNSTIRFYLIKDSADSAISDIAYIRTGTLDSTAVNETLSLTANADATQIMFVTFDYYDGSTPQAVTLNGIYVATEEEEVTVTIAEVANTTLTLDDTLALSAVASASDSAITWSSSNEAVATVDANGVVTPVAKGTATITAACGDATDTVEVTVEKAFYFKSWNSETGWTVCSKNIPFDKVTALPEWGGSTAVASAMAIYGLAEYFPNMLPASLAGDADLAAALASYEGMGECIDKFVFEATITKCTSDSAKFQGMVQAGQDYGYVGQYADVELDIVDDAPVFITSECTMERILAADQKQVAQAGIQFADSEVGTEIAGTCTIKVVLK